MRVVDLSVINGSQHYFFPDEGETSNYMIGREKVYNDDKTALIIFAREPEEGRVKTRLLIDLSALKDKSVVVNTAFSRGEERSNTGLPSVFGWEKASKSIPSALVSLLYQAFVRDTLTLCRRIPCDERFVFYASSSGHAPFLKMFKKKFHLRPQAGRDLGERMRAAFHYGFENGFGRVVLIGTDCLTLCQKDFGQAFRKLNDYDVVLGPSKDGGYYLIGLKGAVLPLFKNIPWGTSEVLSRTLKKISKLKLKVWQLRELEDIDDFSSLKKFAKKVENKTTAPYTKKILDDLFRKSL